MKRILPCILLLLLSFQACKNVKEKDGPTQMEQVMAVHDEVMPEMKTIAELVGELRAKVDSTEQGLKYEKAMKDLQASHKAMFDWMQNFGTRFTSDEILDGAPLTEEKQKWLDEEEDKVMELKEQIQGSIDRARGILEE